MIHKDRVGRIWRGFTVIELLVVVAILSLLAAILFPVFSRARENARRSGCQSNLKQIGLGIIQYTQDYDEKMPPFRNYTFKDSSGGGLSTAWHFLIYPYVKSGQVFGCPSRRGNTPILSYSSQIGTDVPLSYMANGANSDTLSDAGGDRPWKDHQLGTPARATMSLAALQFPATTISITENNGKAHTNPGLAITKCLRVPDRTFPNHLETANFLFLDGHVKALRPTMTATGTINMWTVTNNTTSPSIAPGAPVVLQETVGMAEAAMPKSGGSTDCAAYG